MFEPTLTAEEYAAIYHRVYHGTTTDWSECARERQYRRAVAEAVAAKRGTAADEEMVENTGSGSCGFRGLVKTRQRKPSGGVKTATANALKGRFNRRYANETV